MTKSIPAPVAFALIGGEHVDLAKVALPGTQEVREFLRDAWVLNGDAVEIDMAAARDVARQRIDLARKERQAEMNDRFMAALQEGKDATLAGDDARWMRAVGNDPRIEKAATPQALKKVLDKIMAEIAAR